MQLSHFFCGRICYKVFWLMSLLCLSHAGLAQDRRPIDSLLVLLPERTQPDTLRGKVLCGLAYLYSFSNTDSASLYAGQALELAEGLGWTLGIADARNTLGLISWTLGQYKEAVAHYEKGLEAAKSIGHARMLSALYNNMGSTYWNMSEYPYARDCYQKALQISRVQRDLSTEVTVLGNIGLLYQYEDNFQKSAEYLFHALRLAEKTGIRRSIATACINLSELYLQHRDQDDAHVRQALSYGSRALTLGRNSQDYEVIAAAGQSLAKIFIHLQQYDSAQAQVYEAIQAAQTIQNVQRVGGCYQLMAEIFQQQDSDQDALGYYQKALAVSEQIGDRSSSINALLGTASAFKSLGLQDSALRDIRRALDLAELIQSRSQQAAARRQLSDLYASQQKYPEAYQSLVSYLLLKDSLFSEETTRKIANLNASYELETKETRITLLEKDKELLLKDNLIRDEEARIRQYWLIGALAGLSALTLFVLLLARNIRQKQKANRLLAAKNTEIEDQKQQIERQNAVLSQVNEELHVTLDLVNQQKTEIQHQHEGIQASIAYALRIQQAMLPFDHRLDMLLGAEQYFVYYRPRDVVSGDFYFVERVEREQGRYTILAVADCTGHGVPGAFMSMIGNQVLSEIILRSQVVRPDQILSLLRLEIYRTLHQQQNQSREGMDAVIVTLAEPTDGPATLQYAGAMNPLYYTQGGALHEIKGDKMAIGGSLDPRQPHTFTLHEIPLNDAPLMLYLCSDGYQDQFGGPQNRKFMVRQLRELLGAMSAWPIREQHTCIADTMQAWMQQAKVGQTDDITVVGWRIG